MPDAMQTSRLWDLILEPQGLTTLFQPIFETRGGGRRLFALEALTRGPKQTNIERSDILFEYVRRKRRESEVDLLAIASALRQARGLPGKPCLSLNVHAVTLDREEALPRWLAELSAEYAVPLASLIIEIVEHAPPWDDLSFLATIRQLRSLGIQIALDDVGLGASNFKMLLDVDPDYLKVDRFFVEGCSKDHRRRAVIAALQHLARDFGAEIIAEGVSDNEDAATLRSIGVTLMQGFQFAEPLTLEQAQAFFGSA
jgi:EAL domain-containing protein (putative c-di-GMP-specific phosphodiesterase class I)